MKIFCPIFVCLFTYFSAAAQTVPDSANVRKLLEMTGSAKLGLQVMNMVIESSKQQNSGVPKDFWDEFAKEVDPDDLVNRMIPLYNKYYTNEDVLGLIQFYETPLGKKMIRTLPQLSADAYAMGSEWGKELAEKVMERLTLKGYIHEN